MKRKYENRKNRKRKRKNEFMRNTRKNSNNKC